MTPISLFLGIVFTGLSIIILIISMAALRRKKRFRFAMITLAFFLFSVMSVTSLLSDTMDWSVFKLGDEVLVLNIGIVVSIYLATIKG